MTGGTSPCKPTTRSSIRQSLTGLAGKAFADVIHKDSDKSARKAKDASSRRLSGLHTKSSSMPRSSIGGDVKSPPTLSHRAPSAIDTKTVTRRRVSNTSSRISEDQSSVANVSEFGGLPAKATTVRPRTGTTSGLPKYRPKSIVVENNKQSSPKTGSRRPLSNSEDEKDDQNRPISAASSASVSKASRPISPLPHRAALKNLSSAVNVTPPATPTPTKQLSSSTTKPSPRPTKLVKMAATGSGIASSIPRPPSSTSTSSFTPHTPRTHGTSITKRGVHDHNSRASPTPASKSAGNSPVARHTRQLSKGSTNTSPKQPAIGNMSLINEADSEEDEAEDVALLLAPIASFEAPTPAMPRMQSRRTTQRPRTSDSNSSNRVRRSRKSSLHTRAQSSGASPRPSPKDGNKAVRGSILSWEQLATDTSFTLGEGEVDNMLADVDAPFNPALLSPTPSNAALDIPESPCLSALSSPGGYGSISQVLLPEVTPSPAPLRELAHFELAASTPQGDSGTVNLLRLQLAAMENTAKERLYQMQKMEEEIYNLKQARNRDAQDLMNQVTYMEEQMRGSLEIRERAEEERAAYISDLQQQLHEAREDRDLAVSSAEARGKETARSTLGAALKAQEAVYETGCSASSATLKWQSVRSLSEMELDHVRSDMEVLSLLLSQLDQMRGSAL